MRIAGSLFIPPRIHIFEIFVMAQTESILKITVKLKPRALKINFSIAQENFEGRIQ